MNITKYYMFGDRMLVWANTKFSLNESRTPRIYLCGACQTVNVNSFCMNLLCEYDNICCFDFVDDIFIVNLFLDNPI